MGKTMSRVGDLLGDLGVSHSRIVMVGLDAAGKTTILSRLKPKSRCNEHMPTVGFNVETVSVCKNVTFTVWDVAGQEKLRGLWTIYYKGSHGILFVVDSSDRDRIPEVKEELHRMCQSHDLKGVPLVIIANKQDKKDAMRCDEMTEALKLDDLSDRLWSIHPTSASRDKGINEAISDLACLVKQYHKSRRNRRRTNTLGKGHNVSVRSRA